MASPAGPMGLPSLGRFGAYSTGATSPAAPMMNSAANDADATKWYESGPVWVLIFLFAGYILVYRTIR